jgi:hypothetical protein
MTMIQKANDIVSLLHILDVAFVPELMHIEIFRERALRILGKVVFYQFSQLTDF